MRKKNHIPNRVSTPAYASPNSRFPGGLMRMSAVVVFTLHELEAIRRVGGLAGIDITTELGWHLYAELQAMGFRPTSDESRRATATLMTSGTFKTP